MDVVLLGTGNPLPHPDRAGPATLVRAGGLQFLVDCGRGVLMRLAAAGAFPGMLASVLLTHLHSDHVSDFNDVLTTRWVMSPVENPLEVVGPVGTDRFVARTLAMLDDDIGYRLAHHDDLRWQPGAAVTEVDDGVALERDGVRVVAAPTDHRPVHPTVGYRFEHDGHAVVVAGDTVPCEGLDRLCAGADVYVQTVIRRSLVEAVPDGPVPGHPRLPLERRGRGPHRGAGRGRHARAHALRPAARRPAPRASGSPRPPPTSTARSCCPTTW